MSESKEKTTGELFADNVESIGAAYDAFKLKGCSDEIACQLVNQALSVTGAFGIGAPSYNQLAGCAPKRESLKVPHG